jgi:prolipoprotein diacylglyceryltransferase
MIVFWIVIWKNIGGRITSIIIGAVTYIGAPVSAAHGEL